MPTVNGDDDFFHLGGTSLSAALTAVELSRSTGKRITLADVLGNPGAVDLARLIDERVQSPAAGVTVPGRGGRVSFDQERRLFRDAVTSSPGWRISLTYRLRGAVDVDRLGRAVRAVAQRHEALRMRLFIDDLGVPGRAVAEIDGEVFSYCDDGEDFDGHHFDRARGVVFGVRLMRTGELSWLLLIELDHIVGDAYSTGILLGDISRFYNAPASIAATDPPAQFGEFIERQRARLEAPGEMERHRAFWRDHLGDCLLDEWPAVLPADFPARADTRFIERHRGLSTAIGDQAMRHVVCLAALNLTLAAMTGHHDHVVATPVSNRDDPAFADTIGWISSLVAVRTRWSTGAASTSDLLRATREAYLTAIENALPWGEIIKTVRPDSYLGAPRQPQVYFDFLGEDIAGALSLQDITCTEIADGGYGGYVVFSMLVTDGVQGCGARVTASDAVFDEESTDRLLRAYACSLAWIVERGDEPLAEAERDVARHLLSAGPASPRAGSTAPATPA
ncbi:condensation domain-containing protein [Actinoplanes subglobosus]|uniref:Condensation domain-containing protein n=1 Tax=Actinoplanes subglobosus TaxID=1547892 RepID=A0ABV8IV50_9ACTN